MHSYSRVAMTKNALLARRREIDNILPTKSNNFSTLEQTVSTDFKMAIWPVDKYISDFAFLAC